jgi:hypothetical protein
VWLLFANHREELTRIDLKDSNFRNHTLQYGSHSNMLDELLNLMNCYLDCGWIEFSSIRLQITLLVTSWRTISR